MSGHLRVATAGAGYFSQYHHEAWTRMDGVDLVGVHDRDTEKADRIARTCGNIPVFDDFQRMIETVRPDLVDIITPPPTHLEFIRAAAASGINVVCQKPFCESLASAQQAVDLAERAGTLLVIHENFRFQPWYAEIRRNLDLGTIGEPYQLTFRLRPGDGQGPGAYLDRQPYFQAMERFLVHETAIHVIDTFRYLMGEVKAVYADLRRLNPAIQGEDAGIIVLDFGDGVRGVFDGNRLVDHAAQNRRLTMGDMLLEGSEAVMRLDGNGQLWSRPHGLNDEQRLVYDWHDRGFGGDCVWRLQQHVVNHLRKDEPIMNTGRDYLRNLRIEESVYESARLGERIVVQ